MQALTTEPVIDHTLWKSEAYRQFCQSVPKPDHPPPKKEKVGKKEKKSTPQKTPPELPIVAGFSQIFTEYPGDIEDFDVYVNLHSIWCYLPQTTQALIISVEYREYHPLDSTGSDHVNVWVTQQPIFSSRDFYKELASFHETIEDSHLNEAAIYPYFERNYSTQFKRGRVDPLFSRDEVAEMWKNVTNLIRAIHGGGGSNVRYPWMGPRCPSFPVTYQDDHSSVTIADVCNLLPTSSQQLDFFGWHQKKPCYSEDEDEEYT